MAIKEKKEKEKKGIEPISIIVICLINQMESIHTKTRLLFIFLTAGKMFDVIL